MKQHPYRTPHQMRNIRAAERRRPTNTGELVEVHDTMRAVLGADPEAMAPQARAYYLLDETRLKATGKEKR